MCLHIFGTNLSSTEINVEKDGGFYEEINKKDIGRCERDYIDYRLFVSGWHAAVKHLIADRQT